MSSDPSHHKDIKKSDSQPLKQGQGPERSRSWLGPVFLALPLLLLAPLMAETTQFSDFSQIFRGKSAPSQAGFDRNAEDQEQAMLAAATKGGSADATEQPSSCEALAFDVIESGAYGAADCTIAASTRCGDLNEITGSAGQFLPSQEFQGVCHFTSLDLSP